MNYGPMVKVKVRGGWHVRLWALLVSHYEAPDGAPFVESASTSFDVSRPYEPLFRRLRFSGWAFRPGFVIAFRSGSRLDRVGRRIDRVWQWRDERRRRRRYGAGGPLTTGTDDSGCAGPNCRCLLGCEHGSLTSPPNPGHRIGDRVDIVNKDGTRTGYVVTESWPGSPGVMMRRLPRTAPPRGTAGWAFDEYIGAPSPAVRIDPPHWS